MIRWNMNESEKVGKEYLLDRYSPGLTVIPSSNLRYRNRWWIYIGFFYFLPQNIVVPLLCFFSVMFIDGLNGIKTNRARGSWTFGAMTSCTSSFDMYSFPIVGRKKMELRQTLVRKRTPTNIINFTPFPIPYEATERNAGT